MHERTFIMSMLALDVLFIATGGVFAWARAIQRLPGAAGTSGGDPVTGVMSVLLIAAVGGWMIYQLNLWAFALAEWSGGERRARGILKAFVATTLVGGAVGLMAG